MSRRLDIEVPPSRAGTRLDSFLGEHGEVGSRARAQRLIEAGAVEVGGRLRPKRHRVEAGDSVIVTLEPPAPPVDAAAGRDVPYEVAHEDEHLLVVDKPAGVVTHPAPGHPSGTLSQALTGLGAEGGDPWRPGIVHRLDRDTSGLLVVAKSDTVHRSLQDMIRRREVDRRYLALVEGRPDAERGTIDAPIGRDRVHRTVMSTRTDRPREARTHFRVAESFPRTALLDVRLETGRTHQIRAHLAAIGHPVCGDPQYGGRQSGKRLGLTRQFLHSARIAFTHPATGADLRCESKLPVDLRPILDVAAREPAPVGPDRG